MTAPALGGHPTAAAVPRDVRRPRILVIGYGNPGRQDDGLGPAAAAAIEQLGWPEVTTSDNYQLVIEDAIQVAAHDEVWLVDAAREGDAPYTLERVSPTFDITFTSHLLKPATLLALAGQQFGRLPPTHLLGIRGYEFDFLDGLTERAGSNLVLAVALMRRRIGERLQVPQ